MKRFNDTEKWSDKFFRSLTPSGKVFSIWLSDNCDYVGFWESYDDLFKFLFVIPFDAYAHMEELGEGIESLEEGKILLPEVVLFQKGGMVKEGKPPQKQILRILEKNGLE